MPKQILTQAQLKEVLNYDPLTGLFTWKLRLTNRVKIGEVAGTMDFYGYINIQIHSVIYKAHRLVFLWMDGFMPIEVDHVNGVRDDNKYSELSPSNRSSNCKNAKIPENNTSGVIGISWNKARDKWEAKIGVAGKTIHLGRFQNKDHAIYAREVAEKSYGFHPNHGRS